MASSALAVVQEEMWRIGEPVELDPGTLPLKSSVFNHYLLKRKQKIAVGEWKSNVSVTEVAKAVKVDVEAQWEKTGIPHTLQGKQGVEKVKKVILQCQDLLKINPNRRGADFALKMESLFDVAVCQHDDMLNCICSAGQKVPPNWIDYLKDQRGSRQTKSLLSERVRTLRDRGGVRELSQEEKEEQMKMAEKAAAEERKRERLEERKRKSSESIAELFNRASIESDDEVMDIVVEQDEDEREEDWEDVEEERVEESGYNTLNLKNFAREVDRYGWSDRGAAKAANGLLKDLGIVRKGRTKMLICPAKVRRERQKWGKRAEDEHNSKELPGGPQSCKNWPVFLQKNKMSTSEELVTLNLHDISS